MKTNATTRMFSVVDNYKRLIEKWNNDMKVPFSEMSDEKRDGIIHCQADLLVEILTLDNLEDLLSTPQG
jgi:hypothetical protein